MIFMVLVYLKQSEIIIFIKQGCYGLDNDSNALEKSFILIGVSDEEGCYNILQKPKLVADPYRIKVVHRAFNPQVRVQFPIWVLFSKSTLIVGGALDTWSSAD